MDMQWLRRPETGHTQQEAESTQENVENYVFSSQTRKSTVRGAKKARTDYCHHLKVYKGTSVSSNECVGLISTE